MRNSVKIAERAQFDPERKSGPIDSSTDRPYNWEHLSAVAPMTEERAQRHLAAILAADAVGYSRLMEQDEADTFAQLRMHRRELFEPEINKHRGRIFKLMGDGLLAEFGSVADAVECAVVLQRGMAERNNGVSIERRIDVRIGINLGDVIVEGEDRHGEGVNIA